MGLYAANGTINVTVVSGSAFVGAYAADGSLNVLEAPGNAFVGRTAPCGAMYVTVAPGTFVGSYAPDGSVYVTDDVLERSGALRVTVVSGNLFTDASAQAFFDAMPTPLTAAQESLINTFIEGLKTDSLWNKIDGGNFLCLSTAAQCYVDFKVPSRVATVAGSPTFTFVANRQFTPSGAAGQTDYIDTGFVPSSAGGQFTRNSAMVAIYSVTAGQNAQADIGANGATDFYMRCRTATDATTGASNSGTATFASGVTDGSGFFIFTRTTSTLTTVYRNGSSIGTNPAASSGLCDAAIRYMQIQGFVGSTRGASFACFGGGLSAAEVALLNTRVQTVITGLRAL